jgi:UDP-2,4-diacetamido-2,4,6-trideoxy-beta-L-altropyranose hydrolase
MKIAFRVDASSQIGTGHFMRCLTLASALKQREADIRFISRSLTEHFQDMLNEKNIELISIENDLNPTPVDDLAHAHWLGMSQQQDAQETLHALSGQMWDWLIVDHYGLDARWENLCRPLAKKIFVIDDLADRKHNCDLLLDQNLVADKDTRYFGKVPEHCGLLLGPEYALLQPIYAELHNRVPQRNGKIQRILIYFGGADIENLTGLALAAFIQLERPDIHVDVVLGSVCLHAASIKDQIKEYSNIIIHRNLPNLAYLMIQADLAIGACGVTSWERLCLGLPSLVITVAENQRTAAEELHRLGLIQLLGHKDSVDEQHFQTILVKLTQGRKNPFKLNKYFSTIDGKGLGKVFKYLNEY